MHTTQSAQNSTKQTVKTNTGCFHNLFSGLQQSSPENEFRIDSVQRKKNGTNYLHAYRNRTNLPCDVCQGLKCGAFEQDFTDFGWIFAVRILGLEGERERVSKK